MKRKHLLAIVIAIAMLIMAGSVAGLAQEDPPADCEVTIEVRTTDGILIHETLDGEAAITVRGHEDGHDNEETKPTTNGAATFTLKQNSHYWVEAVYDRGGAPPFYADTHFNTSEEPAQTITLYLLQEHETQIYYEITGPVGVSIHARNGHLTIGPGGTEFPASSIEIDVHNVHGYRGAVVKVQAFTLDGVWHEKLVFEGNPQTDEIAIFYTDDVLENANWVQFGVQGDSFDVLEEDGFRKHLFVKAEVGEGTEPKGGSIYFKAVLESYIEYDESGDE